MENVNTEVIDGITYTMAIAQDDISVRGNALASGDDAEDKEAEDAIIERLENGETWAWASVRVTAEYTVDGETFEGTDHLGACSYTDTKEFITPGGYYDDMKSTAKDNMVQAIREAVKRGDVAKTALPQFISTDES